MIDTYHKKKLSQDITFIKKQNKQKAGKRIVVDHIIRLMKIF
jgi:hypothetical protein